VIKNGEFNKEGQIKVRGSFSKRWPRKFCSKTFYNSLRKFNTNAKIIHATGEKGGENKEKK
jgi:hypothetical protein